MLKFNKAPKEYIDYNGWQIAVFLNDEEQNIDLKIINSFSAEWGKFKYFSNEEIEKIGQEYFDIINENILNKNLYVLDLGCGSGRWTKFIADKVNFVEAIDPSESVYTAANLLENTPNVRITKANIDNLPFDDESFDFAFSLGVLHHIPDTKQALKKLVKKVKINGHVLVYLYYRMDNRGLLYKIIFIISNAIRKITSQLPLVIKKTVCDIIAIFIYLPMICLSKFFKMALKNNFYKKIPLSYYIDKSFRIIRNDALDRFGTTLEQRFSKKEINKMMIDAGLYNIIFSDNPPFWHAVGERIK
ncbi:MAG: class I SAM-dependent methyltransferase [Bacteroidota bacterium]